MQYVATSTKVLTPEILYVHTAWHFNITPFRVNSTHSKTHRESSLSVYGDAIGMKKGSLGETRARLRMKQIDTLRHKRAVKVGIREISV